MMESNNIAFKFVGKATGFNPPHSIPVPPALAPLRLQPLLSDIVQIGGSTFVVVRREWLLAAEALSLEIHLDLA